MSVTQLNTLYDTIATAAAFKYGKFYSNQEARKWYDKQQLNFYSPSQTLIKIACKASDPMQFIAKVIALNDRNEALFHPISQDASASAYQIMSYLLLNTELGRLTNLIPSTDGRIQDVYMSLCPELLALLPSSFPEQKCAIIRSRFSRKLVKGLFMPMIYGKTMISMAGDLKEHYGSLLVVKDCFALAKLCYDFWQKKGWIRDYERDKEEIRENSIWGIRRIPTLQACY